MESKKRLLAESNLYLILDAAVNDPAELPRIARTAGCAGAAPLQLRYKGGEGRDVLRLSREILAGMNPRTPFIVNDRADICHAVGAAGVHLGQEDLPLPEARRLLGDKYVIGASCQTIAQVRRAVAEGADYIGFGSVFKTLTKPDRSPMDLTLLEQVVRETPVPVYAIGGITAENIDKLLAVGVTHFAVCRAICRAEDVTRAVTEFKGIINPMMKVEHA